MLAAVKGVLYVRDPSGNFSTHGDQGTELFYLCVYIHAQQMGSGSLRVTSPTRLCLIPLEFCDNAMNAPQRTLVFSTLKAVADSSQSAVLGRYEWFVRVCASCVISRSTAFDNKNDLLKCLFNTHIISQSSPRPRSQSIFWRKDAMHVHHKCTE